MASIASPSGRGGELGLSSDGIHWDAGLMMPLFDPQMRWVPGDTETATFYIRHHATGPADLTIDVISSNPNALMDTGDLHITASGGGDWTTVSEPGIHRLLVSPKLKAGSVTPVQVDVTFSQDSTNFSQLQMTDLSFRVTLSESSPIGPPPGQLNPSLPVTGSPKVWWIAVLGAVLVGAGLALAIQFPVRKEP